MVQKYNQLIQETFYVLCNGYVVCNSQIITKSILLIIQMSFGNKYSDFLLTNMMKSLIFIFDLGAESCILKSIKFKHNFDVFLKIYHWIHFIYPAWYTCVKVLSRTILFHELYVTIMQKIQFLQLHKILVDYHLHMK